MDGSEWCQVRIFNFIPIIYDEVKNKHHINAKQK